MIKSISLILTVFLFSGCIGIGFVHDKEFKNEDNIGKSFNDINKSYSNLIFVKSENGISSYRYKTDDFDLIGIIPMVGIGIPLVIPVGYLNDDFKFKNNVCVEQISRNSGWTGFMCGMLNENGAMGCSLLK